MSNLTLLVVSHTPHYETGQGIVGWGPTVRELDTLTKLFREVVHIAPLHAGPAPASALPYGSPVRLRAVRPAGGARFRDKAAVLRSMPGYLRAIPEDPITRAVERSGSCTIRRITSAHTAKNGPRPRRRD